MVTKFTQTLDEQVSKIVIVAEPEEIVAERPGKLLPCEAQLNQLNQKVIELQSDLKLKITHSEKRSMEKRQLLQLLTDSSPITIKNPEVDDVHHQRENSTQFQITQVLSKELSIQSDLQACIDKLLMLKDTLSEKVLGTVSRKSTELSTINQLVEFVTIQAH